MEARHGKELVDFAWGMVFIAFTLQGSCGLGRYIGQIVHMDGVMATVVYDDDERRQYVTCPGCVVFRGGSRAKQHWSRLHPSSPSQVRCDSPDGGVCGLLQ